MEEIVDRLFAWWTHRDPTISQDEIFSPDFRYVGVSPMLNADEFIFVASQGIPWSDARVVGRVVTPQVATLVFEGTDPVTELYHRICWLIEASNGRIVELVETSSIVDPSFGKTD